MSESEEERIEREENVTRGEETNYTVNSETPIADEHKSSIFVFDEDFLRNNVRDGNDGLNAIVMLGEQVELDEKINAKNEELSRKTEEFNQQEELVKRYSNIEENISPRYYWNQIREGLRENGGWADIDRDLKGNTLKSRITDDLVNILMKMEEPAETYEQLRERVKADMRFILGSGRFASNRVGYRQIDAARKFRRLDCTIRKSFGLATVDRKRTATDGTINKNKSGTTTL